MCRCVGFLFGDVDQLVSRLLGRAINCSKQLHFDRVGHRVELNPMVLAFFDLFALLWLHSHVWPFTTLKLFKGDAIELNCKVILDCTTGVILLCVVVGLRWKIKNFISKHETGSVWHSSARLKKCWWWICCDSGIPWVYAYRWVFYSEFCILVYK